MARTAQQGVTVSIRQGLLALLAEGPRHGYQLRADFDARTGGTWPLNIGQVYTTLARLERDGLVTVTDESDESHKIYAVTDAGHTELTLWFTTPVHREERPRDELAIKLAMAANVPGVDITEVVRAQRTDSMRALQDYTRLKRQATDAGDDLAWALVLDSLIFATESEIRWLEACEERLARRIAQPRHTAESADSAEAEQETVR